jgi:hypothetical protein
MGTKAATSVKKAPTLNDSRFHTINTLNGIKALDRWKAKGKITAADEVVAQTNSSAPYRHNPQNPLKWMKSDKTS